MMWHGVKHGPPVSDYVTWCLVALVAVCISTLACKNLAVQEKNVRSHANPQGISC